MRLTFPTVAVIGAGLVTISTIPARGEEQPIPCPREKIRVVRSAGSVVDYEGAVPGIPDLCHMTRGGEAGDFYFGVWRTDWPGAGQAYPAMRQVLAAGPGARAAFITRSYPGFSFVDTFSHQGWDTVVVNGVAHATLKFAHERQGIEGNTYHSIITSWRDRTNGMVLKTVEDQISGQSYGPETTWHAVRIERLP